MTFPGNITLIYIDRTDLFGPLEKRALAIPRGISYENFRARLEGAVEVKQPPERILVALSRLYTTSQAGTPGSPGRRCDEHHARVYKLTVPGAEPRCREGNQPHGVFDEMVRHLEKGTDVNLQLQRPWHLDSGCMADDDTDDFDIEDHQVLPRLPRNRGITDVTSTPAPYERFLSQQEAPLEQNPRLLAPGDSVRPRALQSLTARQSQSCQTTAARLPTSMPRESKRHRLNLRET
ncbi:hypothetical protein ACKVWC_004026 [Pyricularia oryzae]